MNFNNTTTKNGMIQRCELLLDLGDTVISGSTTLLKQFTGLINSAYQKVSTMILDSQDAWDFDDLNNTTFPIASTSMVASQRDYPFPSGLLKVKRVDLTYDGTNYYKAEPFDSGEYGYGIGNDTNIDSKFSISKPVYDIIGGSVWIFPKPTATDVTNGGKIRVEFQREITEFASTDTTDEPGFDEPFHPMLPIIASMEWAIARGLPVKNDLAVLAQDYESRLKKFYGRKELDKEVQIKPAYVSYE